MQTPSQAGPSGPFTFRPLVAADLELCARWLSAEHVRPWWETPADLPAYFLDEREPVRRYLALLDGRPIGFLQSYRWADHPAEAAAVAAEPGEVGLDYLIGELELVGQGVGPAMLAAFLDQLAFADQAVTGVRVDVSPGNRRSWRCLQKVGFHRVGPAGPMPGEPGRHDVYLRER